MKEFLQILRRFVPPYKKYLGLSVLFNILSAVLNIFSFAALIPILQILFQVDGGIRANDYMEWDGTLGSIKEVATNNLYYYIQEFIVAHSASLALLVIGLFLAFMTFLKTGAYFLSSATIILSVRVLFAISATSSTRRLPRFRWASSAKSAREISSPE